VIFLVNSAEDMDNGDISQHQVTHFCIQGASPCCRNEEEALQKTQRLYLSRFGAGFDAPLLYRFKHVAPANDFMQDIAAITNAFDYIAMPG
jgi:hypothetical protein